jgi:hypothetical protein
VTVRQAFVNILMFAFLGLVGGTLFDALRSCFDLGHVTRHMRCS